MTRGYGRDPSQEPISGPLADLLSRMQREPVNRRSHQAQPERRASQTNSRIQFLAELEACGDIGQAADKAGCSLEQVRAWRRTDPKFDRDYVLALASHLRMLKRRVQELAETHESPKVRDAARQVLGTEHQHAGPDGRLNARAWRDSLAAFIASLNADTADLEPTPPPHQHGSEPEP